MTRADTHSPKVSVIVPIHNVEKYVYDCLASLCRQTLRDIEIICVNDCTPDNSMKIVRDFAKADKRIRILEMEKNGGQDIARSYAMKIARGEYIGFVDSDDYVDVYFYENLYAAALKNNADIVSCYAVVLNNSNGKWVCRFGFEEFGTPQNYSKEEYFIYTLHNGSIWNRIYRKNFLLEQKIDFPPEIRYICDTVFLAFAVALSSSITVIDYYGYVYVQREGSTMRMPKIEYYNAWFFALNKQAEILQTLSIENKSFYISKLVETLKWYSAEGAGYFPEQRPIFDAKIEDFKRKFAGELVKK